MDGSGQDRSDDAAGRRTEAERDGDRTQAGDDGVRTVAGDGTVRSEAGGVPERAGAEDANEGPDDLLERLFREGRTNAVLAWLVVGVLALAFVESAIDFDHQWMAFVAGAGAIVLLPPVAFGEWRVMLPWELLLVALLPILVRGLFHGEVGTFAMYVSIAALALVITVELHTFTALEVTHWFAVILVVLTTMASVAVWSIVRWTMDLYLGTNYLTTNDALMVEFVRVTLAGLVAGVLFDAYFTRRDRELRSAIGRVIRG